MSNRKLRQDLARLKKEVDDLRYELRTRPAFIPGLYPTTNPPAPAWPQTFPWDMPIVTCRGAIYVEPAKNPNETSCGSMFN